jgi:hypothetical protein
MSPQTDLDTPGRPPTRWPARAPRRLIAAGIALALALATAPATASAEQTITTQAIADDGAFLPYAPPPTTPAAMCLVDTGVNMNPDTEGVVVDRTAIDGGSGSDVSPEEHGTVLAMMAAAPRDGWGMVGTAPTATRIVSVRILQPGQTTFPFSSYAAGITVCLELRQGYEVKSIDLSLGNSETPSSSEYNNLANTIERAEDYGVAVVAAAGNDDGGSLDYPAAYPTVLSVGASDTVNGALCAFSNHGEGLRMLAPGCDLDGADPMNGEANYNYWQGTSEASDITDDALTALRAYRPELTVREAENDLTNADDGTLNIAQSFRIAGLSEVVAAGEANEPAAPPSTPSASSPSPPPAVPAASSPQSTSTYLKRLPLPRLKLTRQHGRLLIMLQARPGGARAQVRRLGPRGRTRRLVMLQTITTTSTAIPLRPGTTEVEVRYIDPYATQRASPWATLRTLAPQKRT